MSDEQHLSGAASRYAGARSLRWLLLSGLIVLVDQLTKNMAVHSLDLYQRVNLLPVLDLVRLHNTGAAFSLFADGDGWQNILFSIIALVVSAAILWWQWRLPAQNHKALATGLALVLGGAIGNVIDRFVHGYVIDFILFYYREWAYPAFNVADSAITCGVVLILVDGLFLEKRRRTTALATSSGG